MSQFTPTLSIYIRYAHDIDTDHTNLELVPPAEGAPGLDKADLPALLTALLFTSGELVETERLTAFLVIDADALAAAAKEAAEQLRHAGLDILAAAGGYKLVSAARFDEPIGEFHREVRKSRLSKSALEVLAIVAYDQPVSRAQIDEVRQVNSESTVRALLDRRLITVAGRQETPGRPFLYKTTDYFLEVFGLASLKDLPPRPSSLASAEASEGDLGPFAVESEE